MIKVLHTSNEQFEIIEMNGHADSAPYGQDLVCAAASAIVIGGINAIKNDKSFDYEVKTGHVLIRARKNELTSEDKIVLNTILTQLYSLQNDYAKYIQIEERN